MKNVTKLASIAIISTTMISAPAMASTSSTPAQPQVEQSVQLDQSLLAQSTTDLGYAFADEANVQYNEMIENELSETEGAGLFRDVRDRIRDVRDFVGRINRPRV